MEILTKNDMKAIKGGLQTCSTIESCPLHCNGILVHGFTCINGVCYYVLCNG
ncbi:hypothetical protein [Dinghuibacter silviterrae]|uniref:Bacteriocin-like protein n=1 Tax=Dinghuibacter silviterrae TaxID=1539049 RepID=A0A4R8DVP6_9BACT|nr:hypothetical protein [Dinghuibacter silviterrae]TDX01998.1 hypothetical protein EDB95_3045 [Dinghuibacter silviterrae]